MQGRGQGTYNRGNRAEDRGRRLRTEEADRGQGTENKRTEQRIRDPGEEAGVTWGGRLQPSFLATPVITVATSCGWRGRRRGRGGRRKKRKGQRRRRRRGWRETSREGAATLTARHRDLMAGIT